MCEKERVCVCLCVRACVCKFVRVFAWVGVCEREIRTEREKWRERTCMSIGREKKGERPRGERGGEKRKRKDRGRRGKIKWVGMGFTSAGKTG